MGKRFTPGEEFVATFLSGKELVGANKFCTEWFSRLDLSIFAVAADEVADMRRCVALFVGRVHVDSFVDELK